MSRVQNIRLLRSPWRQFATVVFNLVALIPLLVYRWLVQFCAKILRPDLLCMLRGDGPNFLRNSVHLEPSLNLVVGLHLDGPLPEFEGIKKLIDERIVHVMAKGGHRLAHPELQQYCVKWCGFFFWKQEKAFRLEDHILVHGSVAESDEHAKELQVKYMREPLPACRSPWQFFLIPAQYSHYLILKIHHSFADGFSTLSAFTYLVDTDTPTAYLNPSKYREWKQPSGFLHHLKLPARIIRECVLIAKATSPVLPWPQLPAEPATGGVRQEHTAMGNQFVEVAKVKLVAKQHSVSTTAVLYAALTGALRWHLVLKYGQDRIPSHVKFLQTIPVADHPEGFCNAISVVTFQLPIGEADAGARLKACDQMIRDRKQSLEGQLSVLRLRLFRLLPEPLRFWGSQDVFWSEIATSNLPGPLHPVKLNGRLVLGMDVQVAVPPSTFCISIMSYNGILRWVVKGDTRVFTEEELKQIADAYQEEIERFDKI